MGAIFVPVNLHVLLVHLYTEGSILPFQNLQLPGEFADDGAYTGKTGWQRLWITNFVIRFWKVY